MFYTAADFPLVQDGKPAIVNFGRTKIMKYAFTFVDFDYFTS
jgi:hypothetical protein